MDIDYWKKRWEEGRTGFHESEVNPFLSQHLGRLPGPEAGPVLVPLSGKSRDMAFLAGQGRRVVGIEASPLAASAFFDESGLSPEKGERGPFHSLEAGGVTLLEGDFFAATPELVGPVAWAYDRAALIAIKPEDRARYVDTLLSLLPHGGKILLVSFAYDQSKMQGPPFSVTGDDVASLFSDRCDVEKLDERVPEQDVARYQQRGLDWVLEAAYLLTLRPADSSR